MASEFFREWRAADRAASTAERSLVRATLDGETPDSQEVSKAKRLRAAADDLFQVAMRKMAAEAERLKRG